MEDKQQVFPQRHLGNKLRLQTVASSSRRRCRVQFARGPAASPPQRQRPERRLRAEHVASEASDVGTERRGRSFRSRFLIVMRLEKVALLTFAAAEPFDLRPFCCRGVAQCCCIIVKLLAHGGKNIPSFRSVSKRVTSQLLV